MSTALHPSPEAYRDRLSMAFWLILAFASISTLLSLSRLILPPEARSFLPPAVVLMPQIFCVIHLLFYRHGNQLRSLQGSAIFQLASAAIGLYWVFRMAATRPSLETLTSFWQVQLVSQLMWTIFIPVAAAFSLYKFQRQRHPAS